MDTPVDDARRTGAWPWIRWGMACLPFLAILVYQIATTAFLCDDAFISFRYARNLVAGHGLVFNRGEYVEGYVHLLWTLEVAGLWCLGLRPEISAHLLSITLTAGTLALVVASALRLDGQPQRRLVAWLALGLVACCPSFAVWSTSGLEARQFTFLVVLGSFLLTRAAASRRCLMLASMVFAAAELTRPEGMLIFACAFAWRLVQDKVAGQLRLDRVWSLALPFTAVLACHFVWRYCYYGDWLPNPYYAKYVRAWYESGFTYLASAAIELGTWVWVPLAWTAMRRRGAARDLTHALPFVLIVPHLLYLLRLGGDHFEFRPMDFYLPLLAVPAAMGLVQLVHALVGVLPIAAERQRAAWQRRLAVAACVPVIVYSHGLAAASLAAPLAPGFPFRLTFDETTSPLLQFAPGLPPLRSILNHLRDDTYDHFVAMPTQVLAFSRDRRRLFEVCERLPDGVFPTDAMATDGSVGVIPFYLREVSVIDSLGLTDAVIARTPSSHDNASRKMAHDRWPPTGYLRQRGVNMSLHPVEGSETDALRAADFALRIDPNAWLPLRAVDREYAQRSFPSDRLVMRHRVDSHDPAANEILLDGKQYVGVRLLATFEPDDPGLTWSCKGDARVGPTPKILMGGIGVGQLSIAGDPESASVEGSARSEEFVAEPGAMLVMFLAGQRSLGLQVNLCRRGEVVRSWSPATDQLQPVVCPLDVHAGQPLSLEVHDPGPGWLVLDHVLLVRQGSGARAALSAAWSAGRDPLMDFVRIAPLRSVHGCAVAGYTTITASNPMPFPTILTVELVEGPADACLLCGPWMRSDGRGITRSLATGATAQMQLNLKVSATPIERQTFTVRIRVQNAQGSPDPEAALVWEVPLPWQERD